MDEMNSAFDIEVVPKKENKEKQIQYKKYDKNKRNEEIVKAETEEVKAEKIEVVEPVKQELEDATEKKKEESVPVVKTGLKEGWARGTVTNRWKTSAWVVLENGCGLTLRNASQYSVGQVIEFELPSWYKK